jgi:hypothetical protein
VVANPKGLADSILDFLSRPELLRQYAETSMVPLSESQK